MGSSQLQNDSSVSGSGSVLSSMKDNKQFAMVSKNKLRAKLVEMYREQKVLKSTIKNQKSYIDKLHHDKAEVELEIINHQNNEADARQALENIIAEREAERDVFRARINRLEETLVPLLKKEEEEADPPVEEVTVPQVETMGHEHEEHKKSMLKASIQAQLEELNHFILDRVCACH